jgi:glycosyltransferase involved in cell wall biosynthesis
MSLDRKKAKVLYVCRLFNGLETSIKTREWHPTGVPTIYKIIENLDSSNDFDLDLVITPKSNSNKCNFRLSNNIKINGLTSVVTVLSSLGKKYGRIGLLIQEMMHVIYIVSRILFRKYDLLYIDNANIFAATIVARMKFIPVIFRVMGVYPAMRSIMVDNSIKGYIMRKCYSSPFSSVICTQDGSGVEPWLDMAINKNTPVCTLINGVDLGMYAQNDLDNLYKKYKIPEDKFLIFFLGKIEKIKGIYEFIEGFSLASKKLQGDIHAVVVGHGDQYKSIIDKFGNNTDITFIARIPHGDIDKFHKISDLYISTNRLANLTNANLEAMASGDCIVIPKSQPDTSVDLITDELLDNSAVYRIPFPPTSSNVKKAIDTLFFNSKLRESMSLNVLNQSKKFITSWDERINRELKIISSFIKTKTKTKTKYFFD